MSFSNTKNVEKNLDLLISGLNQLNLVNSSTNASYYLKFQHFTLVQYQRGHDVFSQKQMQFY